MNKPSAPSTVNDLRGVSKLAIDATTGITDLVEAMHRNIARVPGLSASLESGQTSGITGFVYRSVRGVTKVVGGGIDAALALAAPLFGNFTDVPARDAIQSALNGVLGDHLVLTNNPLALPMQFRRNGETLTMEKAALSGAIPDATGRVLVLIHGLCMNDRQWKMARADGSLHDHGEALQTELGHTAIYLRYNTGLHVSTNGHAFSAALDELIKAWPVPVKELVIVAHSMGGLVTRSACHYAGVEAHNWTKKLKKIIFLGTPHLGSPLERGGHWIDIILGATPYAKPFAKLGKIRSSGITDLRHGSVLDDDWQAGDRFDNSTLARHPVPLPAGVKCFTIAGTIAGSKRPLGGNLADQVIGDGLVPRSSALGEHRDAAFALDFPVERQATLAETTHMQLLSSAAAYEAIKKFVA